MEQTYWTPRTSRLSDGYITRKSFLGPWVQLKAFNVSHKSQALPSEPAGLKLTPHSRLGVCNYPAVGYKQRGGNCCPRSHRKGLPAKRGKKVAGSGSRVASKSPARKRKTK